MKSILRSLAATIAALSLFFFLFLTTIRFQILNPNFLISIFRQPDVYSYTERAFQLSMRNALITSLRNQGIDIDNLTVGERLQANRQIEELTILITKEKLKDLIEKNIIQILAYVNGQEPKLYLYFPIDKWGLPVNLTNLGFLSLLSEKTDLQKLIEDTPNPPITNSQLSRLYNFQLEITKYWWITLSSFIASVFVYFLLGKSTSKTHSTGILLLTSGGTCLAFTIISRNLSENLTRGLPYWNNPIQILLGAILPLLIAEASKPWLYISLSVIILGFAIIFINYLYRKRKENIAQFKAKNSSKPLA